MKRAIKRKAPSSEDEPNRLTKKRKIEPDLAENLVLPRDILIEIMEYLNSKELVPSSLVSKHWLACSRGVLGWIFVRGEKLGIDISDKYKLTVDKLFVSSGSIGDCLEVRLTPVPRRKLDDKKLYLADGAGKLVGSVSFRWSRTLLERYVSEGQINEPYSNNSWLLKTILRKDLRQTWDKYSVYAALYVNAKTFQRVVMAGQEFPKQNMIFEDGARPEIDKLLKREYNRIAEYSGEITHETPMIAELAPEGLNEGVKFHRYQLNAISWMKSVEANVEKEWKSCYLVPWKRSNMSVLFDLHTERAIAPHNANEYSHSIKSKGGILADETGLGKTCEIIGLVLCSLSEQQFPEFDANGLFNTNATLVICPNDLAVQWEHEVLKFTNLKVSMLAFPEHLKSVTYDDVVESDIVIVTAEMFKSSNYLSLGCGGSKISSGFRGHEKRKSLIDKSLKELRKKRSRLSTIGPVLEHFHFKRIVVDEGHQVLEDKFIAQYIYDLKKRFAWFVSSTPFSGEVNYRIDKRIIAFNAVKKLLEICDRDIDPKIDLASEYDQYLENNCMVSNLLWRNTKESVKEEYRVPESIEEVIKTKFHPIEAIAHKYAEKKDRIRLCDGLINWPLAVRVKNNMTLDGFKDWKIASLKDDAKNLRENRTKSIASWSVPMEEQDEVELDEFLALPYVAKGTKLKGKQLEHLQRVNKYGTKCAELMRWMSDLIAKSSSNRFLLFNQDLEYQTKLSVALRSEGIENVVIGGNIVKKSAALQQILEGTVQVALLNSHDLASGMSLNHVNYVVYLSTIPELVKSYYDDGLTTEREHQLQVLNLVHRQGQDQKVTLVRFVVQDSIDEDRYQKYQKLLARGDNSEEEDSEEEEEED